MSVQYRQVVGFPGYRVGSDGSVWTCLERISLGWKKGWTCQVGTTWKPMRLTTTHRGYLAVCLRHNKKVYNRKVHALVMEAFVGPRPPGLCILHGDDDRKNNSLDNLVYGTHQKNMADMVARGRSLKGMKHPRAKMTDQQVRAIVRLRGDGWPMHIIAEKVHASISVVRAVTYGLRWSHISGIPARKDCNEFAAARN